MLHPSYTDLMKVVNKDVEDSLSRETFLWSAQRVGRSRSLLLSRSSTKGN